MIKPQPGQTWRHRNGDLFTISCITEPGSPQDEHSPRYFTVIHSKTGLYMDVCISTTDQRAWLWPKEDMPYVIYKKEGDARSWATPLDEFLGLHQSVEDIQAEIKPSALKILTTGMGEK